MPLGVKVTMPIGTNPPPTRAPAPGVFVFPSRISTQAAPYAMDQNGNYRVVKFAPGGKIVNGQYVPPQNYQAGASTSTFREPAASEKRWTDPKMAAANQATVKGDFRKLYFDIAPRGGGPQGIGAGYNFNGKDDDYQWEGGNIYPELGAGAKALELSHWWGRQNGWDARYGSGNLDLNWLRVYVTPDGWRAYKPFSKADMDRWAHGWYLSYSGFVCPLGQVRAVRDAGNGGQAGRLRSHQKWNVHYAWHINSLAQCQEKSSKRRRSNIKKVAAVAAVVVGAVYLGPMVAGALKGSGAVATAGVKTGIAKAGIATGAKAAAGVGAKALAVAKVGAAGATIASQAKQWIPKVVDATNNVRTVKAIVDGEVPPPPISIEGNNFKEYAVSVGQQILEKELADKKQALTDAQMALARREMDQEIARIQNAARGQIPAGVPTYPMPQIAQPVQQAQAEQAEFDWLKIAAVAVPVVLVMSGRA